jgi:hypothetical protein
MSYSKQECSLNANHFADFTSLHETFTSLAELTTDCKIWKGTPHSANPSHFGEIQYP